MFQILFVLPLLVAIGVALGTGSAYIALWLAPLDSTMPGSIYYTVAFTAALSWAGLVYLNRRWGIGPHYEPDSRINTTSTMMKAIQAQRLEKWNNGIRCE